MAIKKLEIGDKVRVLDPGLLMLQKFAPVGAKPNNEGIVNEILDGETVIIEFPLSGENHSQVAPYPISICHKID